MPLLLMRHGPTALNHENPKEDRIRGWKDVPLSPEGQQIAGQVAQQAARFPLHHLFASDLSRAADTAGAVQQVTGLPLTLHPELRPWNLGQLQGQPTDQVMPIIRKLVDRPGAKAPGGESFDDFLARFSQFILPLLHDPRLHGVVTHIRNIKTLEALIAGKGKLDRKVWDQMPSVQPGGLVMAGPDHFTPLSPPDKAHKGVGS